MNEIIIDEYAVLTTKHPASKYNIPVLVTANGRAYGPSDKQYPGKFNSVFGVLTAAHSVYSFAINNELDEKSKEFVKSYLKQWPEGPQID